MGRILFYSFFQYQALFSLKQKQPLPKREAAKEIITNKKPTKRGGQKNDFLDALPFVHESKHAGHLRRVFGLSC
jgi:hypothetical protein